MLCFRQEITCPLLKSKMTERRWHSFHWKPMFVRYRASESRVLTGVPEGREGGWRRRRPGIVCAFTITSKVTPDETQVLSLSLPLGPPCLSLSSINSVYPRHGIMFQTYLDNVQGVAHLMTPNWHLIANPESHESGYTCYTEIKQ